MSAEPAKNLPATDPPPQLSTDDKLPFLEHLIELRAHLVHIAIGITCGTIAGMIYSVEIFELLSRPIKSHFAKIELIGTGPTEAFIMKLKVSLAAGLILSLPYTFFEVWRFISPGLHERERKIAIPFVLISTLFFLSGVLFCYDIMLPFAFDFFNAEYESIGVQPNIRIGEHLGFTVKMMFVFGFVFETPVFCYFLARLGILRKQMMTSKWRYIIVGIFIVAGVLTPPDVVTQMLLATPLLILYGLSIFVVGYAEKKRSVPTAAS